MINRNSKFYFADHCLEVKNDALLEDSPLKAFSGEKPFASKSTLDIADAFFEHDDGVLIAEESGVAIYQGLEDRWVFRSSDRKNSCVLEAAEDYKRLTCMADTENCEDMCVLKENMLQLLRVAAESLFSGHNGLSIHASCLAFRGKSILFTAPSGTGKSTQAEIWIRHLGATLVSGDRPHLSILPDAIRAYGVPWDGKEQRFVQDSYPVTAIVEVRQSRENHIRVLSPDQAFALLLKQSFVPMWDDERKFLTVRSIRAVANRIPFYRLFCNMEDAAADLLESVIFGGTKEKVEGGERDMKIKEGFILRNVVDEWIVMPKSANIKNFEGAIVLNDVSSHIWKQLENPISREDLLKSILDEFDVSQDVAEADMDEFLGRLSKMDILAE